MEDWGSKYVRRGGGANPHKGLDLKLWYKRWSPLPPHPHRRARISQISFSIGLWLIKIRRINSKSIFILILENPPSLVNLKTVKNISAWMEDESNIYIGRACRSYTSASYWQNPFSISSTCSREQAISRYEEYVKQDEEMLESLPTLGGMTMGCWCVPLPCHGQVLIKYFTNYVKIG